jgi:hypothetical protein
MRSGLGFPAAWLQSKRRKLGLMLAATEPAEAGRRSKDADGTGDAEFSRNNPDLPMNNTIANKLDSFAATLNVADAPKYSEGV